MTHGRSEARVRSYGNSVKVGKVDQWLLNVVRVDLDLENLRWDPRITENIKEE